LFSHRSETRRTEAYALASSLAAAALDGLFEHPGSRLSSITARDITVNFETEPEFFRSLLYQEKTR
jgi:hypothetical protein